MRWKKTGLSLAYYTRSEHWLRELDNQYILRTVLVHEKSVAIVQYQIIVRL